MTKRKFEIPPKGKLDYAVMMLENIRALKDLGGLATKHDIEKQIIKNTNLSEEEQSYLQKTKVGTRRTRLDFALTIGRSCLIYADALENPRRSFWKLTEKGFKTPELEELDAIYAEYAAERRAKAKGKKANQKPDSANKDVNLSVEEDEPDDIASLEDDWKITLSEILETMDGYAFERLCQRLLSEAGFVEVNVNEKKGGDGGIDGTGILRINLISFKVYFQCKRWEKKHSVPPKEIRDFRGALDSSVDKGLFITTSSFSKNAKDESEMMGKLLIDLIDGDMLCDLLKEYNLGIYTDPDGQIIINHEWFDRFNIEPPKNQKPKPQKTKKRKK